MKGDSKVISYLNQTLKQELTSVNQYFLHAKMFENMGLKRLYEYEYKESIGEMKHADELIERILFSRRSAEPQDLGKLMIGENVPEMLGSDLKAEQAARPLYLEAIAWCESVKDYVSRELLEDILENEEEHIDWLETQLGLIDKLGIQNYLQSQTS